jgi:hypothetical protein
MKLATKKTKTLFGKRWVQLTTLAVFAVLAGVTFQFAYGTSAFAQMGEDKETLKVVLSGTVPSGTLKVTAVRQSSAGPNGATLPNFELSKQSDGSYTKKLSGKDTSAFNGWCPFNTTGYNAHPDGPAGWSQYMTFSIQVATADGTNVHIDSGAENKLLAKYATGKDCDKTTTWNVKINGGSSAASSFKMAGNLYLRCDDDGKIVEPLGASTLYANDSHHTGAGLLKYTISSASVTGSGSNGSFSLDNQPAGNYAFSGNAFAKLGDCAPLGAGYSCAPYALKDAKPIYITVNSKSGACSISATKPTSTVHQADPAKDDTCQGNGFGFSWLICQAMDLISKAVDSIFENIITPLLITKPLRDNSCTSSAAATCDSGNYIYQAWSNFRVYGNVFLIIALLVVVLGESLGGGVIDAYAVRKILPRLLVAAILINISFYIVAVALDITNIIGGGLQRLIVTPFRMSADFKIHIGGKTSVGVVLGSTGLLWAGAGAAAAVVFSGEFLAAIGLFVLLPAFLITLGIMLTVFVRQAMIVFLTIVSPVAFALYCLPNTEKYFKAWWDALFKALLVYPIIAVLFALGDVTGVLMTKVAPGIIGVVLGGMAFFTPLLMIPFAFKIAGGILSRGLEFANGMGKRGHEALMGNVNDPNSLRNRTRNNMGSKWTQERERQVAKGNTAASGIRGFARRRKGALFNYGNLQAQRSRYNKETSQRQQDQIATGDDSNIRDSLIAWDSSHEFKDKDGNVHQGAWFRRMDMENGKGVAGAAPVYKGAGAYQRGYNAKKKAQSLNKGKSGVQGALYYEWKKTSFRPEQMERIQAQYGEILAEHKLTGAEGGEIMTGVNFAHAPSSLSSKYTKYKVNDDGSGGRWEIDRVGLVNEGAYNYDTYGHSKTDSKTFDDYADTYTLAGEALSTSGSMADTDVYKDGEFKGKTKQQVAATQERLKAMATALNPNQRVPDGGKTVNVPEDGAPQTSGYGGVSSAPVEVQAAAARFFERVHGGGSTSGGTGA